MSALIENGWTFQSHNDPAWHKEGTTFPEHADPDAAWRATGESVVMALAQEAIVDINNRLPVTMSKTMYRISKLPDGETEVKEIGPVGVGYTPVQPLKMLHQWDDLYASGLVELETGGWLLNGIFWSQAKLMPAVAEVVPGDVVLRRYLLRGGFDGKHNITLSDNDTRVVCANTMAIAEGEDVRMRIKLRHTKNVNERLDQATMLIQATLESFTKDVEKYRALTKVKLNNNNLSEYFWKTFAPEVKEQERNQHPRIQTKISHVFDLMDDDREYVPAVRGTAWHAYNAVAHYLSHDANKDDAKRLESLWFGNSAIVNRRAMTNAVALMN